MPKRAVAQGKLDGTKPRRVGNPYNTNTFRNPTIYDTLKTGSFWFNQANFSIWGLAGFENGQAQWIELGTEQDGVQLVQFQTNGAVQAAMYTVPLVPGSIVNITGSIVGKQAAGNNGLSGFFSGGVLRGAAGGAVLIVPPVVEVANTTANVLSPTVDIIAAGNNLELAVTGVAGQIYNWTATITTITQLG